ncbi:hypothetical protein Hanom_Chr01g00056201 [Helianthus anomalus]
MVFTLIVSYSIMQPKPRCKSFRSTISSAVHRLPTDVSSHLCLSLDNLHHVTVQNEKCELLKLGTRGEKSGNSFRYGFKSGQLF